MILATSLFYKWKSQFNSNGIEGLRGQYHRVDPGVRDLEDSKAVNPGDEVVVFRVFLGKGTYQLKGTFNDMDNEPVCGTYYANIEMIYYSVEVFF